MENKEDQSDDFRERHFNEAYQACAASIDSLEIE